MPVDNHAAHAQTTVEPTAGSAIDRSAAGHRRSAREATIVIGSVIGGLAAAIALVVVPFAGAPESKITGALLLGFALGWGMLAVLSARFTDRPQRWAAVAALAMGLSGVALIALSPGSEKLTALGWLWPPALLALVAWMTVHARRQLPSRTRPLLLYPVFAFLALTAAGGAFETLRGATDSPGDVAGHRLVNVGGYRLDITCTGSGSPTVVLEPGLGESASAMARWIAPDVAGTTRVCVYDRAGHGHSDAAPGGRADAARDLHVLLRRTGIPGPYVLVGHSLGGLFALDFTRRYPTRVAGVVLLDSMHPRQSDAFAGAGPLLDLVPTLARTGLARIFFDPRDGDPKAQARQVARDVADMPAAMDRAAQLTSLGGRPLGVVTAGEGNDAGWRGRQDQLAALSTDTTHRIVAGATHASLVEDEAGAAVSSRAIRDIVDAVRGSTAR